jgi:hypothetical protein
MLRIPGTLNRRTRWQQGGIQPTSCENGMGGGEDSSS